MAELQIAGIILLIQAEKEKEGWDKDPPWVNRGKNGQFGGGSGGESTITEKAGKKLDKLISNTEEGNKKLAKDFVNISRQNEEKLLGLIWSDSAKKARQDLAKTLDEHLPGAGKSFEKSVDFINKEIIDRSDPHWDKFIANSFDRSFGRLKRRVLGESTPIDKIDDAVDAVAGIFASAFTVGVASNVLKIMSIPGEIAWSIFDIESKVIGNFYIDAFKSGDPAGYMKNRAAIGLAAYILFVYGVVHYTLDDAMRSNIDAIFEMFSPDVAKKAQQSIESTQKDMEKKLRSQQADVELKLLAEVEKST